jgi:hypothetical protein
MAASNVEMSRLLLFWLLLLLDLFKDAGCFISSLALFNKIDKPKRVCKQHLVCLHELVLMRLSLHKEDLFILFLYCGQLHYLMDVAIVEVDEKLYSTPHELMHQNEGMLLGGAKPEIS